MSVRKIMIIDEDKSSTALLKAHLERENNEVIIVSEPRNWYEKFNASKIDLVITDILFQNVDGWQICKDIRSISVCPIIISSYKNDSFAKVLGFELGVDDYIVKPFDIKELVARAKAQIRRFTVYNTLKNNQNDKRGAKISYDNLCIDMVKYELFIKSKQVMIPPKEMELLFLFASNPNKVLSRNQLLDEIWGFDYYGDSRTVDVHIKRLREKIDNVSNEWKLKTIWGVGYKFEVYNNDNFNTEKALGI